MFGQKLSMMVVTPMSTNTLNLFAIPSAVVFPAECRPGSFTFFNGTAKKNFFLLDEIEQKDVIVVN
jgi:hypothetical protein